MNLEKMYIEEDLFPNYEAGFRYVETKQAGRAMYLGYWIRDRYNCGLVIMKVFTTVAISDMQSMRNIEVAIMLRKRVSCCLN